MSVLLHPFIDDGRKKTRKLDCTEHHLDQITKICDTCGTYFSCIIILFIRVLFVVMEKHFVEISRIVHDFGEIFIFFTSMEEAQCVRMVQTGGCKSQ